MLVNREAVERVSRYRSVLLRLQSLGFGRVFSDNLGDALGISASQVRKDFATYGVRGVKRGGYRVADLLARISEIHGVAGPLRTIVIGCGKIGTALLRMYGGRREGVSVVAGFDVNPQLLAPQAELPVLEMRELPAFVRQQDIRVAILCTPEEVAPRVLDQLRQTGVVRGVLNFTPASLRSDAHCLVQSIDIRMEIEKLFCLIHLAGRAVQPAQPADAPSA